MHITHIYEKYKFSPLFYILFFHNCLFSKNLYGVKLEGQLTQNWRVYLYMHFFGTNIHLILLVMQNTDLDLYFTF